MNKPSGSVEKDGDEQMKVEKLDRRIRRTKAVLRKTLTELLADKALKDITVSELTETADINRGTFYLHYRDIYDLFEQIEQEILLDFLQIIQKYRVKGQLAWTDIVLDLFRYIHANADIFVAILKTRESVFLTNIIRMSRPKGEEWRNLFPTAKEEYYEYYYAFFTAGCVSLLETWLEKGMPESCETLSQLAEKLMTNCIRDLD